MRTRTTQQGIGLIEVLAATVILAIGLLAVGVYQGELFNAATDSKARGIATALAQGKLDDLKSFQTIRPSAGQFAFVDIADDAGGALNGGNLWLPSGDVTGLNDTNTNLSGIKFTREWEVMNLFQPPVRDKFGNTVTQDAPIMTEDRTPDITTPDDWNTDWDDLPTYTDLAGQDQFLPDAKQVKVTVSWKNLDDATEQVAVTGTIQNISLSDIGLTLQQAGGNQQPVVRFDPGLAPDIINIPIDTGTGRALEATKPEPTVIEQGGTTMVQIEEIGYSNATGDEKTLWRNSLLTVNCVCDPSGTPDATDPTLYAYPTVLRNIHDTTKIGDADIENTGAWVQGDIETSKNAAVAASGNVHVGNDTLNLSKQPPVCNVCCGSHHDYAAPSSGDFNTVVGAVANPPYFDPQRPLAYDLTDLYHATVTHGHVHFMPDNSGQLVAQTAGSGIYLENCRLIRGGGYWWVTTDWNLVEVNVMPSAFLQTEIGIRLYQNYVKAVIANHIGRSDWQSTIPWLADGNGNPIKPWSFSPTSVAVDGTLALIARAIYVDHMSDNLLTELTNATDNPDIDDYMPRVPFHEVNVTRLANWSVTEADGTPTTAATVRDDAISNSDFHRGIVTGVAEGDVKVWVRLEPSNSGITDTRAIDPDDQDFAADNPDDPSVSTIDVAVGSGGDTDVYLISGSLVAANNAGEVNYSDITVSGSAYELDGTSLGTQKPADSISCNKQPAGDGTYTFQCAVKRDINPEGGSEDLASGVYAIAIGGYNYEYQDNQGNIDVQNNEVDGSVEAGADWDQTCVQNDGDVADTTQFEFSNLTADIEFDLSITKDNNSNTGGTCLVP